MAVGILTNIKIGEMKYQHTMKKIFGCLPFISSTFLARRLAPKKYNFITVVKRTYMSDSEELLRIVCFKLYYYYEICFPW